MLFRSPPRGCRGVSSAATGSVDDALLAVRPPSAAAAGAAASAAAARSLAAAAADAAGAFAWRPSALVRAMTAGWWAVLPAADVVPGDGRQRATSLAPEEGGGNETAAAPAVWVRAASRVQRRGLYNPLTLHGDLIVDGYRVSTFTSDVPSVVGAVLSAPLRALYVVTGLSTTLLEAGMDRLAPMVAAVATGVVTGAGLAVGSALRRRSE
mgnify:CR=1 FL=1